MLSYLFEGINVKIHRVGPEVFFFFFLPLLHCKFFTWFGLILSRRPFFNFFTFCLWNFSPVTVGNESAHVDAFDDGTNSSRSLRELRETSTFLIDILARGLDRLTWRKEVS